MTISRIPSVEGGIQPTLLTTKGDLISATAASTVARLPVGSDAQILVADSTASTGLKWATPASGMTNPMTTTGDTIYSSSGSTPARLGIGTTGQVLTVAGGVPSWATAAGASPSWSLLSTTTMTGAATKSITGLSGYNQLLLVVDSVLCGGLYMTFNSDAGANYINSGVSFSGANTYNTSIENGIYVAAQNSFLLGNTNTNKIFGYTVFQGCNTAGSRKIGFGAMSANSLATSNGGAVQTSIYDTSGSVISSIQLIAGSTFTGGTCYIYGSVI